MNTSNIYRFNGVDPFDNWTTKNKTLIGYYPRNSLINLLSTNNNYFTVLNDKGVVLPNIKTVGRCCFRNNIRFKEIEISEGVISIEDYAFKSDIKMNVYLPKSIKHMKKDTFSKNVTLYLYEGSYAHRYAKIHSLNYQLR